MLKELRAQYRAKLAALRSMAEKGITDENRTQYQTTEAEMRGLGEQIQRLSEIEELDAEARSREEAEERARAAGRPTLPQPGTAQEQVNERSAEERDREHRAAYRHYMLTGDDAQLRAQQSTVGANGGYAIPTTLNPELDRALQTYGGLAPFLRQLNTSTGEPINLLGSDNNTLAARTIAENTDAGDTTVTINTRQSTVATLTTGIVKVPRPLLQDSIFDFESFVREELGESYGRGIADYLGGTVTDAAFDPFYSTITAATMTSVAPTDIGLADVYNLYGDVDPAYANQGSWVMNRATNLYMAQQRNDLGAPIFPLDANGMLTNLLGRPIVIDTKAPNIAAGNRALSFGALQKFFLRKVPGMEIMRLDERFATANQVAFLGFFRTGSKYVNSGKNPIKALVQHA